MWLLGTSDDADDDDAAAAASDAAQLVCSSSRVAASRLQVLVAQAEDLLNSKCAFLLSSSSADSS
jgi:hypothetical protein